MGRIERRTLPDRLLQRLEHRLGQPLSLHFLIEYVDAKEVFDMRLLKINPVELMLCTSDRIDRFLANVRTHRGSSSGKKEKIWFVLSRRGRKRLNKANPRQVNAKNPT